MATRITNAPAAFTSIAEVVNEHAKQLKPLRAGQGITITDSDENRLIAAFLDDAAIARVAAAASQLHPFLVTAVDGSAKVTVRYGTITGGGVNVVPTIGGTSIAATTPPELTVVTGTVYLKVTVDTSGAITAAIIDNAASTPTDTSTLKYRTITNVSVSGTEVTVTQPQSVRSSLMLYLCNDTAIWEQT